MKEISKELLSLVLGRDVGRCDKIKPSKDKRAEYLKIEYKYDLDEYINLDTLGRLCKEWVYKEFKTTIQSAVSDTCGFAFSPTYLSYPSLDTEIVFTEVEAIIDVTEHIAKEKGLL